MSRLYKFHCDDTPDFLSALAERKDLDIISEDENPLFVCDSVKFRLRLPLFYPPAEDRDPLWHYLERVEISEEIPPWNIVLMEAGRAAVGAVVDGELVKHKNIRKYMVRKKSGKAQLTHLKTKGKSRYGSRLRLQESEDYFREIIERLQQDPESNAEFVFYHCPVRLKSYLDEASEGIDGFEKFTWRKLGVSVKECSFNELKRHSREPFYTRLTLEDDADADHLPDIPEYKK